MLSNRNIRITDYLRDSGYGRVVATYDNGVPYEDILKENFDSIAEALAWLAEVTKEPVANAHVAEPFREILNNVWEGKI